MLIKHHFQEEQRSICVVKVEDLDQRLTPNPATGDTSPNEVIIFLAVVSLHVIYSI